MNTIIMTQMEDSFIANDYSVQNFSKFAYLKVGAGDNERSATNSLIKFKIENLDYVKTIQKAILELYVKNISADKEYLQIAVYGNEKNFYEEYVTWQNAPSLQGQGLLFNVGKLELNKYIKVDITEIVKKWIKNREKNNGITLVCASASGEVTFVSSRGYNSPKLNIKF